MTSEHPESGRPDQIEELVQFLRPALFDVLDRLDAEEFTTAQFIEVMQTDPAAKSVYDEALRRWGEDLHYSKMVVHGQVIPAVLRQSTRIEWAGFAHGEPDPYAVPAWWRVVGS
jgi:hypothetical protein